MEHIIAAKAIAFKEAQQKEYIDYTKNVITNAKLFAQELINRDYNIISNGTDNHCILIDLRNKNITGKEAERVLGISNITVNKNSVPNDPQSPFVTSGIRVGTPAPTTRGFKEAECIELTNWMCDVIENLDNEEVINSVKKKVIELCRKHPVYAKSVALNAVSAA